MWPKLLSRKALPADAGRWVWERRDVAQDPQGDALEELVDVLEQLALNVGMDLCVQRLDRTPEIAEREGVARHDHVVHEFDPE